MGIEAMPPASDASSRFQKSEPVKSRPKTGPTGKINAVSGTDIPASAQRPVKKGAVSKEQEISAAIKTFQAAPEKPTRLAVEMEALSEKLKILQKQTQVKSEISSINMSVIQTRREIARLSKEKMEEAINATGSGHNLSYWDKLEVTEKARIINNLKERIRSSELQRSELTQSLRDQVMSGTYRVSGTEIFQGMLNEYF